MAHGAPDYGNVFKVEFTKRVDDMAELAARLTNAVSFERGGEVFFIEHFGYGLHNWITGVSGLGASVHITADQYVSKGISVEMIPGSDASTFASMSYRLPYMSPSKMGVECRLDFEDNIEYFQIYLKLEKDTGRQQCWVRYFLQLNRIDIFTESSGWVTVLDNFLPPFVGRTFSFIKVTMDFTTGFYKELYFNNNRVDLSLHDLDTWPTGTKSEIYVEFQVKGDNGFNNSLFIDNIILTRNE